MKLSRTLGLITAASLIFALSIKAYAEPQNNEHALAGVDRGEVLFDITLSEPRMLTGQMQVIHETYQDLLANGITPKVVLAFHGQNVHFLTKDLDTVSLEDMTQVEAFNENLNKLIALDGVRIEACAIATRFFGADRDAIREGIHVVGNTYVSNIGYDKQGYTIIGIH